MVQVEAPNYYAIIPADVRYADIPAQAKLLYGELTTLTNKMGYCWATNQYFANLYGMTEENISRLFKKLEDKSFIKQEYDFTQDNKSRRKIYLIKTEPCQKCQGSLDKNVKASLDKNVKHNNTSMNNTSEYKVSKKEAEQMSYNQIVKNYFQDKEMQNTITEFIKMRKLIKKPITNYGLKLICDKLVKDFKQEERIAVVQQSIMNNWQGLYPLKKSNSQELKDKAREIYIQKNQDNSKSEEIHRAFEGARELKAKWNTSKLEDSR